MQATTYIIIRNIKSEHGSRCTSMYLENIFNNVHGMQIVSSCIHIDNPAEVLPAFKKVNGIEHFFYATRLSLGCQYLIFLYEFSH